MKEKNDSQRLPALRELLDSARQGAPPVHLPTDTGESLADGVLRQLRSTPQRRVAEADDLLETFLRFGGWFAGAACVVAIVLALSAPRLHNSPPEQGNSLTLLGEW